MRIQGTSTTLTVHFDGQFWVGTVERVDGGSLTAARVVFGAEPSDEEAYRFVLERWGELRFSPEVEATRARRAKSPKRRQREAAKEAARSAPSTKAQVALAEMREQDKEAARKRSADERRDAEAQRYALRKERRRQKRRGH